VFIFILSLVIVINSLFIAALIGIVRFFIDKPEKTKKSAYQEISSESE